MIRRIIRHRYTKLAWAVMFFIIGAFMPEIAAALGF
jgi:hypothetical protein